MAKTELLVEPTAPEAPAKEATETDKDRYNRLLSIVAAKVHMMQQNAGARAEFPEFAELATFADKLS